MNRYINNIHFNIHFRNFMRQAVLLLVLAMSALALTRPALAVEYNQVQLKKSSIRFVARQMGVPTDGHFARFAAQINFDPAQLASSQARIEVDVGSIDVGNAEANDEVKGASWFNVVQMPKAIFTASQLKALGNSRYQAQGKMRIKGKTQDVVATFTSKQEGADMVLTGSIPLRRMQYGIGEGMWSDVSIVADEVQVNFHFVLSAAAGTGADSVPAAQ